MDRKNCIIICLLICITPVIVYAAYVQHYMLPTSVESAPGWSNTANAYDSSIVTFALSPTNNSWITFIAPPDRGYAGDVNFYASLQVGETENDPNLEIEIYHDDEWTKIYCSDTTKDTWTSASLDANAKIEKVRIRCNNTQGIYSCNLKEIEIEVQWVDSPDSFDDSDCWTDEEHANDGNLSTYAQSDGTSGVWGALAVGEWPNTNFGDVDAIRLKADAGEGVAANLGICVYIGGDSLWTGEVNGVKEIINSELSTPLATNHPAAAYYPVTGQAIRLFEVQYCGEYTTPTDYNIIANVFCIEGGPCGTLDPNGSFYKDSETSQLFTADPNIGCYVAYWYLDGNSVQTGGDTYTLENITADHTVNVQFAWQVFTLTYTAGANGSIDGNSPQDVNYGNDGTEVTAVADEWYHFVKWSDDSTDNPRQDKAVDANKTVEASFDINTVTLTMTAATGGDINDISGSYVINSILQIQAMPDDGYDFNTWTGSGAIDNNDSNETTIMMDANYTIQATFTSTCYAILSIYYQYDSNLPVWMQDVNVPCGSYVGVVFDENDANYTWDGCAGTAVDAEIVDNPDSNDVNVGPITADCNIIGLYSSVTDSNETDSDSNSISIYTNEPNDSIYVPGGQTENSIFTNTRNKKSIFR